MNTHAPRVRRLGAGLAASALLATGFLPSSAAGDPGDPVGPAPQPGGTALSPEYSNGWFVELTGAPLARGGKPANLAAEHQKLSDGAKKVGVKLDVRRDFRRLFNGVSADITASEAARLRSLSGVKAVYPVVTVAAPEQPVNAPELTTALAMTGADVAQSELGFTGKGVKVGVIDTGIDIDHPDLGGAGTNGGTAFPTARIVAGYDFVGDSFNADSSSSAYQPDPEPDSNPDDCQGHGTHVAGIVGADGELRGVAPEATLAAYRVFGCGGSTTSDIMLAAMERAHADGMDVVNMSIGSAFSTWPQYPTAVASDALVDSGVVVVASIGNSGANGTWSAGAPGIGRKVIGVASFDNTNYDASVFTVTPDGRQVPYSPGSGVPAPPTSGTDVLEVTGTPASTADGCTAPLKDLTGQVALIQRGACTFYQKAINAEQSGASAVVLYNNTTGAFTPSLAPPTATDPAVSIPVVAITRADGLVLHDRVVGGGAEITWTDLTANVQNPTGGLISSFSSFGLSADLDLKPDLGAPGGLIKAPYPLEKGGQAVLSGTSMSSPHVAGAVALLLEAKPETGVEEVRTLLQNHAVPADLSLAPGRGLLEPVHRQGAGMIHIDRTITSTTAVSPGKLALGESAAGPQTRTLTVTNDGTEPVTYTLGNLDAVSTAGVPSGPGYYLGGSTATFSRDEVTVPAGGSVEVQVTITAPGSPDLGQYGGWVTLTPAEGTPLRVPYAGFVGDYQQVAAMTAGAHGFPLLGKLTACERLIGVDCTMGGSWDIAEAGTSFSMTEGDFPTVLVHLDYPVRSLTATLHEVNPDGSAGDRVGGVNNTAFAVDYLGRSATAGSFTPVVWDGTRVKSQGRPDATKVVPNGTYVLKVTALKALGDPSNPQHVETWTSPAFTVARG